MASYGSHLLHFLTIGLQLYDVTSWTFIPVSEPVVIPIKPDNSATFSVMCQTDKPLVKCQFNMLFQDHRQPLIDLSQGSLSGVIRRKDHPTVPLTHFDVSYNGTGLEYGQCGAEFRAEYIWTRSYQIGCRGVDEAGEWHDMDFPIVPYNSFMHMIAASINPRQVVVTPGSSVSFLLKVNAMMSSCRVRFEQKLGPARLYINNELIPEDYRICGTRLLQGGCGITFKNVTEDENGLISHIGLTVGEQYTRLTSSLIVASPPTKTYFNVDKMKYSVGDTLTATCSSLLSRPVANLTWTLGNIIIRRNGVDDEFQEDVWSWPWDKKNITQRMSLKLEEEHFGKKLNCTVQHMRFTKHHIQKIQKDGR